LELYVGNLPWAIDDAQLTSMFAAHGTVVRAKVVSDRDTGRSRGFGFVTMGDEAGATKAITALNGLDCGGRALTVRKSEPRPPQGGGGGGGGRPGGFGRREGGGGGGGGYGGGGGRRDGGGGGGRY
jgi:RNA recognition motif-containing protein